MRHLKNHLGGRLAVAAVATALVLVAAVVFGLWWVSGERTTTVGAEAGILPAASAGSPSPTSSPAAPPHPTAASGPAASTPPTAAAGPAPDAGSRSPSFARMTPKPKDPATGRVSTLDGLVPDFTLPPIVDGLAPVLTKIPTDQKVVFLTIDDGAVKRDSDLALLAENHLHASVFLAHAFLGNEAAFFNKFTAAGHLVEDHTMTHNLGFINLSYEQQKAEICQMADFEEKTYGRRPVFFRPPGGPYTQSVRRAVTDCGLKAVVDWEAKANAGHMDYQVGDKLRPGDIVLMHFRPEFPQDVAAFVQAQKAAGLKVVLLEDYLETK